MRKLLVSVFILLIFTINPSPIISENAINYSTSLYLSEKDLDVRILQNLQFEHLTNTDGLTQPNVLSIFQDRKGFMWFGTEYGLNRYDGNEFIGYKHEKDNAASLSDNWIWTMIEDSKGSIWLGTLNGGLNRFDPDTGIFTSYRHDPDNPAGISSNAIQIVCEDKSGKILIGTANGLETINPVDGGFCRYFHDQNDNTSISAGAVRAIYCTEEGNIWLGINGSGLNLMNPAGEVISRYSHEPDNPKSLSDNQVEVIFEDSEGLLWFGTRNGLNRYESDDSFTHFFFESDNKKSLSDNYITDIDEDDQGNLWIGTNKGGLNCYHRRSDLFIRYQHSKGVKTSISYNNINDIYFDREGNLWIGTFGKGLNKVHLADLQFAYLSQNPNDENSLSGNLVFGIDGDSDGFLWIGTHSGLNKYNIKSDMWTAYHHDPKDPSSLSSDITGDVMIDQQGQVWVGTFGRGVNVINPADDSIVNFNTENTPDFTSNYVTDIMEDRDGSIWIGTFRGGICRWDRNTGFRKPMKNVPGDENSLNSDSVFSLYQDSSGYIWIGYFENGLSRYDPATDTFFHFTAQSDDPQSLNNNYVTFIHEQKNGALWVGTAGGLCRFNEETLSFTQFRDEVMSADIVYGMLEDDQGFLWISSINGLYKLSPETESFENFGVDDGLQGSEFDAFSYYKAPNGILFFGGTNGISYFSPDFMKKNNDYVPPVVLTELSQSGAAINLNAGDGRAEQITLKWPNNFFEFRFSTLSYAHPEQNQYAYYLEGLEHDWNAMDSYGYGRYTSLPGGNYTLKLSGSNNDGVWNRDGDSIEIKIIPPFWQTWVFRLSVIALIVIIVVFIFGFRIKRIAARNKMLEELIARKTAELSKKIADEAVFEERTRLARELHDSVTQSLHGSMLLSEAGIRMFEQSDYERMKGYLSRLGEISQQALKEMRLLIYELRPAAVKNSGLVAALQERIKAVENRAGIQVQMQVDCELDFPEKIEDSFFQVARESLNNAVKHSKAQAVNLSISSKIEGDNHCFQMIIEDSGIGFDISDASRRGGMGLTNMREQITELNGTFQIDSVVGKGTKTTVLFSLSDVKDEKQGGS